MIAFLHTTPTLLERFEKLVAQYAPDEEVRHFVQERLLEYATATGQPNSEAFNKAIDQIEKLNPAITICTCSTYGLLSEKREKVQRIDYPIANHLVQNYKNIAVAYTAKSTRKATERLLSKLSTKYGKENQIHWIDCSEFWTALDKGRLEEYHKGIAAKILEIKEVAEVFFLAQASMEKAQNYLPKDLNVVSSPEFGVKQITANLNS